jgi:branched-subunit amino acid ABC-type transport system permease component
MLHHTRYGTWIRAVQQNREVATAMGIPASQVTLFVFVTGCALAGLAGVLAAPVLQVRYDMGVDIIIDAFIVVIAAGFGNILGTIVVAMIYQLVQGLLVMAVTPVQAKVLALSAILVWVLARRKGLLEREKR